MKGVVIWGWSRCRSVMGMMREISRQVPMKMALWREGEGCVRERQGHRADEFADVSAVFVGDEWELAHSLFEETAGWVHLVSPYQMSSLARRVVCAAKERGDVVGVICEAPWNPYQGVKSLLWEIYLRTLLRMRVWKVTRAADFFVCYSGEDYRGTAKCIGWQAKKICGYGYFSPPIEGSHRILRQGIGSRKVRILATATKGRRGRGEDVVRKAISMLDADKYELIMPEFISLNQVVELYETCDVFVAAGYNEPWGMRINDALNCGMPFVVSDGMGAKKLVKTTGAGVSFRRGDALDLAERIRSVVSDYEHYAFAAYEAVNAISPVEGARQMLDVISRFERQRSHA